MIFLDEEYKNSEDFTAKFGESRTKTAIFGS